jgi:hypothetical protein
VIITILWHKRFQVIKIQGISDLLYSFSVSVSHASSRLDLLTLFPHAAAKIAGSASMVV